MRLVKWSPSPCPHTHRIKGHDIENRDAADQTCTLYMSDTAAAHSSSFAMQNPSQSNMCQRVNSPILLLNRSSGQPTTTTGIIDIPVSVCPSSQLSVKAIQLIVIAYIYTMSSSLCVSGQVEATFCFRAQGV